MRKLKGTLNLTRTQATRADVDTLNFAFNNSTYTLDVRLPSASRLQMGMADIVAGQFTFSANFANTCHVLHLLNLWEPLLPTHNNGILAQKTGGCKYFYLTGVKKIWPKILLIANNVEFLGKEVFISILYC